LIKLRNQGYTVALRYGTQATQPRIEEIIADKKTKAIAIISHGEPAMLNEDLPKDKALIPDNLPLTYLTSEEIRNRKAERGVEDFEHVYVFACFSNAVRTKTPVTLPILTELGTPTDHNFGFSSWMSGVQGKRVATELRKRCTSAGIPEYASLLERLISEFNSWLKGSLLP
jgi:hypothetical protein